MWVRLFRQLYAAARDTEEPIITLAALLTTAQDFKKVPTAADIAGGAAAVRRILDGSV